jgi:general L-amino acid transport system permease protein
MPATAWWGGEAMSVSYVRDRDAPLRPPPAGTTGAAGWLRENLFSNFGNGLLTVLLVLALGSLAWNVFDWAVLRAVWTGVDREACAIANAGACWPFVWEKFPQWLFGFYPTAERWRPVAAFVIGAVALAPMLMPAVGGKTWNALFLLIVYPVIAYELLAGGLFGLPEVETSSWGGLTVTLVVAVTGIVFSLPLGILLALGRRSELPIVRSASIAFIELWRGVPLVTVLFMASVMLPLFVPDTWTPDKLLRALIGVALFASAYMAEVVRAGLQAIPKGQYEAAMAVGLSYWQSMRLIILPQALKVTIPNIVNTYIGLFKDTTLVFIVGIFDFLKTVEAARGDVNWATPNTSITGYAFAAMFYFVFCYAMSRYARYVEHRLRAGDRR